MKLFEKIFSKLCEKKVNLDSLYQKKLIFAFFLLVIIWLLNLSTNYQSVYREIRFYSIKSLINQTIASLNYFSKANISNQINISSNLSWNKDNECNYIKNDLKQFRIKIDNFEYPQSVPLHKNISLNFDCMNKNKKIFKILFWTTFFSDINFSFGLGKREPFIKNSCPVTNCETTIDKNKVSEADYVIVHTRDKISEIPLNRSSSQQWIFLLYESPFHSTNLFPYNSVFNISSTYDRKCDFPGFYETSGNFIWEKNLTFKPDSNFSLNKTGFAAILVSNCGSSSKRLDLVKQLQKYISVNIFGKCGQSCPVFDCHQYLAINYKFYFSFENSVCLDYITEKFFRILKYNTIPVVFGGGDYEYYIPKSGYINVKDFSSVKELADYLKYVESNQTVYNSYFHWKQYISFSYNNPPEFTVFCDMCIYLNLREKYNLNKKKVIHNLSEYWSIKKNCQTFNVSSFKFSDLN